MARPVARALPAPPDPFHPPRVEAGPRAGREAPRRATRPRAQAQVDPARSALPDPSRQKLRIAGKPKLPRQEVRGPGGPDADGRPVRSRLLQDLVDGPVPPDDDPRTVAGVGVSANGPKVRPALLAARSQVRPGTRAPAPGSGIPASALPRPGGIKDNHRLLPVIESTPSTLLPPP